MDLRWTIPSCGGGSLGKLCVDGDAIRIDKATAQRESTTASTAPLNLSTSNTTYETKASTTQENATYLSSPILRRALTLRQLALRALPPIIIIIIAPTARTPTPHHIQRVVRMRVPRDLGIYILRAGVLRAGVIAMRDMLLLAHRLQRLEVRKMRLLLLLLLLLGL